MHLTMEMWMNSISEDLHLIKEKRNMTFDPQSYFIFVFWLNCHSTGVLILRAGWQASGQAGEPIHRGCT